MKRPFVITLILCLGITLSAGAQTFTQRVQQQKAGEGTVTIYHDAAIDDLVNGPRQTVTPTVKAKDSATGTKGSKAHTQPKTPTTLVQQPDSTAESSDTTVTQRQGHRPSYKVTGYRVQVFAGANSRKDHQKAEQTRVQLNALFPMEQVYVHFYSPRWICRIGNYRTYEEANQMLQQVRRLGYSAATIVKGKITVYY